MSRIDGNVTELSPRIGASIQTLQAAPCWVCQNNLSARAAFCHECGTIQAPRALDHFTRMGIDRRFDIEREQLEGRFEAMQRIFQNERLLAKGPRQKQLASDQMSAVTEAYHTLRDPVTRAQYLLSLVDDAGATVLAEANSNDLDVLRGQLKNATDTAEIDRVAFQAGRGVEACIRELSGAFRQQSFAEVAVILARLVQLEDIAASARDRRSSF